jgi:phosphoribosylformimino-5-aminoimidazole carboxamide ribotide isomerase
VLTQEFEVIPAIDVLEGRVVRLSQGRREAVTIEGGDPVELARRFAAEGAKRLHLVDLDGAFSGRPSRGLVERVAVAGGLPLQVGGGYRSLDAVAAALNFISQMIDSAH